MDTTQIIKEQAEKYDSFYLYDEQVIADQIARLKRDFGPVEFLYSVKANPAPQVVKRIFSSGFGADAASLNEVKLAHRFNVPAEKIQYSAPAKRKSDIDTALGMATIIADSPKEVELIQQAASEQGIVAEIGVRLNPNFTFFSETGVPSKFGIDEELAFSLLDHWKQFSNIRIVGIHVHSRSQELREELLEHYYENMFALSCRFQEALGHKLTFVNMGSGIGIPYGMEDSPIDTARLGKKMAALAADFADKLSGTQIYLETGRFVSGKCGLYITKVIDKKESMGKTFILLQNTLNGFVRPSLIPFVAHYTTDSNPSPCEPFYTQKDAFQITALTAETETESVTLVGNLCTAMDVVAEDILLPKLVPGDLLVITNAGSYAAVLTPMQFASQDAPAQLILHCDGTVADAMND